MSKHRHDNMDKSLYFLSITLKLFSSNILSGKLFWQSALSLCRLGEEGSDIFSLGSSLLGNHCPHCWAVSLSFQFLCQISPFFSCPQQVQQEITIVSPEDTRQAASVASGPYNICKENNKLSFERNVVFHLAFHPLCSILPSPCCLASLCQGFASGML